MMNKTGMSYKINTIGLNFRLSDINCALGLSQLKKINSILKIRRNIYKIYLNKLNNYKNVINLVKTKIRYSSCHLLLANINFQKLKITKYSFFQALKKEEFCQFHYIPIYKFKNHSKIINYQILNFTTKILYLYLFIVNLQKITSSIF